MPRARRREQGSGSVRQLPSGRWQARFRDEKTGVLKSPKGLTFDTRLDADRWLKAYREGRAEENRDDPTLAEWAESWLGGREIKPRTAQSYRWLLRDHILPSLGDVRLSRLTTARVEDWYAGLDRDKGTTRARAYTLLSSMLSSAVARGVVHRNPCQVRRGSVAKRQHHPRIPTAAELAALVAAVPERYRALVLVSAWCGVRFGEAAELRRRDVDGDLLRVERAMVRVDGQVVIGEPKSDAGRRALPIPPNVRPALDEHLRRHVDLEPGALLFPARGGGHLAPSTLYRSFYPARAAAGRPDLHWHDLRHHAATRYAQAGATLAELQYFVGHSTAAAAMIYQQATADRASLLAERMAALATQ